MTLREVMERGGHSSKIPQYETSPEFDHIIDEFWRAKSSDIDHRIKKADLVDTLLDRNERAIIMQMDNAFHVSLNMCRINARKKKAR